MGTKVFKRAAVSVAAAMCLAVSVVGAQIYMTAANADEAREDVIRKWALENPENSAVVDRYHSLCEGGMVSEAERKQIVRPLSFAQCAAQKAGSIALAEVIEQAGKSVEVPAPLRWL
ncbi:hypothetical protein [Pseudomonas sp. F1002]|uniref:hypothetical protein n=1 Tax=Pseudomonas sp. F1002 TaxID=2738821 RepID=UPI00159FA31A|nr:hypothetical protein [Pseudomonas sp. F1002]NWB63552.1 hypothetical protein [Pseudomonas sp. F1002]